MKLSAKAIVKAKKLIWKNKHRDAKSIINKVKYILMWVSGEGTCLVPLDSLNENDIINMITDSNANLKKFAESLASEL